MCLASFKQLDFALHCGKLIFLQQVSMMLNFPQVFKAFSPPSQTELPCLQISFQQIVSLIFSEKRFNRLNAAEERKFYRLIFQLMSSS